MVVHEGPRLAASQGGTTWELRCGLNNKYRVLYDTEIETGNDTNDAEEPLNIVRILAIGEKRGERLFIAGEEWNP